MVNQREGSGEGEAFLEVPLPHAAAPPGPLRLLTGRPFLWLILGDSFAQLARWCFFLAVVGDATYRLDATPTQVGLLLASFSVPLILVAPLYGSAADRWSAKWLLVFTSAGAVGISILALTTETLAWLYIATMLYGLEYAAEAPARSALVPRLVPAAHLVQANGMISAALAVQLIVGPGLGAILVDTVGRRGPYLVTLGAAAFAVVFYLIMPDRRATGRQEGALFADIKTGFREGWNTAILRRIFLIAVGVWFLVGFLIALEPSWVRSGLGQGKSFLGVIWATYGAGEVIGSIILSRRRDAAGREPRFVAYGLLLASVGFLVYVGLAVPATAIAGNVLFGIGFPFFTASSYALIQRLSSNPGKVTAAFSMMGEAGPVAAAGLLALIGGSVSVRPLLLGAGAAFSVVALAALRLARRDEA
jgi:predicted MFS family arabinose efflux permease